MKTHKIANWQIDYHPSFISNKCSIWLFSTGIENQRVQGEEGSTGCQQIVAPDWETLYGKLSIYLHQHDIARCDELDRMLLSYHLKQP